MSDNQSNGPESGRTEPTHGRSGGLGEQYDQHVQSGQSHEATQQREPAQPDYATQADDAGQSEAASAGSQQHYGDYEAAGQPGDFAQPADDYTQQGGQYGQAGGYYGGYPPEGGGPGGPGYGPPPSGPGGSPSSQAVGFFGALFDFSFTHFVTPIIIKVVFLVATVLIGIGLVIAIVSGFASLKLGGILVLIVGPVVALFYLAIVRMTLEFYLAIVRMSEDIHKRM